MANLFDNKNQEGQFSISPLEEDGSHYISSLLKHLCGGDNYTTMVYMVSNCVWRDVAD